MKRSRLNILLLSAVFCVQSFAGELDDLIKLNKTYNSENLSLEFKLDLNYSDSRKESYNGKYLKNKKGFFYSVIHVESFSDEANSVVVDKSQKLVVIGNSLSADKASSDLKQMLSQFKFDSSSVKDLYDLKYIYTGNKTKKIEMKPKDEENEFEAIEVTITEDFVMSEVKYIYRKTNSKNRITDYKITYTNQKTSGEITIPVKLSKYISVNGKKIALQKEYKGYKLIDNRIKPK